MKINTSKISPIGYSDNEQKEKLAYAFHASQMLGWDEQIWNHISVRRNENSMWINSLEWGWDEIDVYKLHCQDFEGNPMDQYTREGPQEQRQTTGITIHGAVQKKRKDIGAIIHTHSQWSQAVSCLKQRFIPLDQNGTLNINKIGYYK